ncbi:DNA-binding protein [Lactobacillus sp. DCY120]|uniref:DNA-binding protein n=1 Tax=Bombilactobacillus apium TaxID=2675299 RepID=A0A850QYF8_9LACO|nr:S1-like domain-containing RNA-binding protein [Bombilactobacillus apium]NVY95749.1 DNA-binding protein [Bombilactobacillus apium]
MNLHELLGTIQTGTIIDQNTQNYAVSISGWTFQVSKKEVTPGQTEIRGFVYQNSHQQLVLTSKIPEIGIGRYGLGEVVAVQPKLGVFLNIGLPDKDLVVSLDDLPELKSLWPQKGDHLLVTLSVDKKDRLWGKLADAHVIQQLSRPVDKKLQNKNLQALVYRLKLNGTYVLTNDYHLGFIHPSEREREPRLGELVQGRVIGMSFDHLNLSLKPRAYEEISDDAAMILEVLKRQPQHQLAFNDKSDPQAIKRYFGISKSSFKRALGNLLKRQLISQNKAGIQLTETASKS